MDWWSTVDGGVLVRLRVTPNARRSEVVDRSGPRLRVRIAAPAVDGKANAEIQRFVATLFGVRSSAVSITAGTRGREKTVLVRGVEHPPEEAP